MQQTPALIDAVTWGDVTGSDWGMVRAEEILHHQSRKPGGEIPWSARFLWMYRDLYSVLYKSEDWGTSLDMKGKLLLGNKMHLVPEKVDI